MEVHADKVANILVVVYDKDTPALRCRNIMF